MESIGVVRSERKSPAEVPIQGSRHPDEAAAIEVFPDYAEGLDDLDGFDYIWVLWVAERCASFKLKVVPFMDTVERGVFSTRSPMRPNGICMTPARLLAREGNILRVRGVDMIDGTPVVDIKPYIASVDRVEGDLGSGWLGGRDMDRKGDDRFEK